MRLKSALTKKGSGRGQYRKQKGYYLI